MASFLEACFFELILTEFLTNGIRITSVIGKCDDGFLWHLLSFDWDGEPGEEREGDDEEGEFDEDGGISLGRGILLEDAERGDRAEDEEEAFVGGDPHDEHEGGDGGAFPLGESAEGVAAIKLQDGQEIEEVHPCAEFGDGGKDRRVGGEVNAPGDERGDETPDRSGETDAGIFVRAGGVLFEADECAEAGDEHRCGGANAKAAEHPDVAHFVDVNGEDNSEGEFPAPDAPVNAEAEEHGEKGAGLGEAEEQEFGLGENENGEEFEFPEEQGDDAEDAAGAGPFWFGLSGGTLWRGFDLADELIDFLADDAGLGGLGRQEFKGAAPTAQSSGKRACDGGCFCLSGESFEFFAVDESVAGRASEQAGRDRRGTLDADHFRSRQIDVRFEALAKRLRQCLPGKGRRFRWGRACSCSRLATNRIR